MVVNKLGDWKKYYIIMNIIFHSLNHLLHTLNLTVYIMTCYCSSKIFNLPEAPWFAEDI